MKISLTSHVVIFEGSALKERRPVAWPSHLTS
jgi:hypothetical protein